MTFERILSHFQVMKRGTGKAQCICPAHVDTEASLTLTDGNDRALIRCHAGCSVEKVVDAAGLKMSDLFYGDGLAKERWRAYIENREKRKIEAVYNYASINGDYAYTKVRLEGKKMLFGILSNERFAYGLNGKNKKMFNAVYGSISSIKRAIERKEPVFIPEGEKDVNTLVKKGYAAFSCGGANDWNKNVSELCKDADVIVLSDNDDPGKKLASTVVEDLRGVAKSIKIIVPMPEVPKADITDYFEAGHTVEEFENLIRNVDDTESICTDVQQDQKQDTRKVETDAIQKLVSYAQEQGSNHAEMLYATYTRLANKMAGISKRDEATVMQLNNLSLMENIILHEIDMGIMKGKHYKEIYKDCKERLETVKDLAYLEAV